MEFLSNHLLSLLIWVPLIGALVAYALPKQNQRLIKWVSIVFSAIPLLVLIPVFSGYQLHGGLQFIEDYSWIRLGPADIHYHLGVDGISLPLAALTALLSLICLIYSLNIEERPKEYYALFLLLEVGMMGTFLSLDFFLFYVFWEISLVPMYFIIGIWGGPRREYAAIKFFLYTLVGSVAMMLAILALYFNTGSFQILDVAAKHPFAGSPVVLGLLFWAFFLAFAIKVPCFPFHTWLPDAHTEAPTAGSVILAGVLLKMGAYGFLRIVIPVLPTASSTYAPIVAILALISIVYGALVAMAQWDVKKLIAYSSINHMGYVMLGIAAAMWLSNPAALSNTTLHAHILHYKNLALTGAVMQMLTHGIITGALFLIVGVIYERTHTRDLKVFGGLMVQMPVYAGIAVLAFMASLGLPGLAGFISEFLVFVGSFQIFPLITAIGGLGIVITAAYLLWTIQRMFLGKLNEKYITLKDINVREVVSLLPLLVLMVVVFWLPAPLLNMINPTTQGIIEGAMRAMGVH